MKFSINELLTMSENNNNKAVTVNASQYSITLVDGGTNGKRVTVSKSLITALDLTTTVYFLPVESSGCLIISPKKLNDMCSVGKMTSSDKKTCYNSALVKLIAKSFNLVYEGKTSYSFNQIELDTIDDTTVAVVDMTKPKGEADEN